MQMTYYDHYHQKLISFRALSELGELTPQKEQASDKNIKYTWSSFKVKKKKKNLIILNERPSFPAKREICSYDLGHLNANLDYFNTNKQSYSEEWFDITSLWY